MRKKLVAPKILSWGWRHSSAIKNYCPLFQRFNSQHPLVTPVPGDPRPFFGLHRHIVTWHMCIQARHLYT